jgi:hypothetical protein
MDTIIKLLKIHKNGKKEQKTRIIKKEENFILKIVLKMLER